MERIVYAPSKMLTLTLNTLHSFKMNLLWKQLLEVLSLNVKPEIAVCERDKAIINIALIR